MSDGYEYLVWVDVETTGIGPAAKLLEVAAAVTALHPDFTLIDEPFHMVVQLDDTPIRTVDPPVIAMHAANGLWAEAQQSRYRHAAVLEQMQRWFRRLAAADAHDATFYWAGRSVHFDLRWVSGDNGADLETIKKFSHRRFDLTPIKQLLSLAGIELPAGEETHRALPDVLADIELARDIVRRLVA